MCQPTQNTCQSIMNVSTVVVLLMPECYGSNAIQNIIKMLKYVFKVLKYRLLWAFNDQWR